MTKLPAQMSNFLHSLIGKMIGSQCVTETSAIYRVDIPHVLSENVFPVYMFTFIAILLRVVLVKRIESVINVLAMSMNELPHGIECIDVINTRTREAMTFTNFRSNCKNIIGWLFSQETSIVQIVVIVMGTQKRIVAFHFIAHWNSDFLVVTSKLFFKP